MERPSYIFYIQYITFSRPMLNCDENVGRCACVCSWMSSQRIDERRLVTELLRQVKTSHQLSSDVLSAVTVLTPQ